MKNHKSRVLGKKSHKVIIMGNSHTRERGYKVRQLLYNGFEVLIFINPGSRINFTKDTANGECSAVNTWWCYGAALMMWQEVTLMTA